MELEYVKKVNNDSTKFTKASGTAPVKQWELQAGWYYIYGK